MAFFQINAINTCKYGHFRWADQCKKKHDSNRRSKDLSWVGQNVATLFGHFGTDSELCDRMIDLWYNEV